MRVAICGAGPSGLSQLHAFECARKNGHPIPELVCFEKQADIGGQWNYSWRTGLDEFLEPVHSSMYHNLWTNLPKECSEFADYSFDEHFGQPLTSFPPRSVMLDYIRGYAQRNNVLQYIRFNTIVRWISYSDAKQKFLIMSKDLRKDEACFEEFDYVIIATGHFSSPFIPYYDGIETFPGRILHAHDFRFAKAFQGQHVLIIGNGISAEDIALQLYKYGVQSVLISYRTQARGYKYPDGVKEVPLLTRVEKDTVYLKDGSSHKIDTIIFCTGYIHYFPFLDSNLCLRTPNSYYPYGLYKSVVWIPQPRLFYLAMQRLTFSLNVGNLQAWYVRDIILGKIKLPSTEEMISDLRSWLTKANTIQTFAEYVQFNRDFLQELIDATDYPRFNVDEMVRILVEYAGLKDEHLLTYREIAYVSTITNTPAKPHHTPWVQEMDDSLENFVTKKNSNQQSE